MPSIRRAIPCVFGAHFVCFLSVASSANKNTTDNYDSMRTLECLAVGANRKSINSRAYLKYGIYDTHQRPQARAKAEPKPTKDFPIKTDLDNGNTEWPMTGHLDLTGIGFEGDGPYQGIVHFGWNGNAFMNEDDATAFDEEYANWMVLSSSNRKPAPRNNEHGFMVKRHRVTDEDGVERDVLRRTRQNPVAGAGCVLVDEYPILQDPIFHALLSVPNKKWFEQPADERRLVVKFHGTTEHVGLYIQHKDERGFDGEHNQIDLFHFGSDHPVLRRQLEDSPLAFLALEYPGYWSNSEWTVRGKGRITEERMQKGVDALLKFIKKQGLVSNIGEQVYVIGASMGSTLATYLASQEKVSGLTLLSGVHSLQAVVLGVTDPSRICHSGGKLSPTDFATRGPWRNDCRLHKIASSGDCKEGVDKDLYPTHGIVLIHGAKDFIISVQQARNNFEILKCALASREIGKERRDAKLLIHGVPQWTPAPAAMDHDCDKLREYRLVEHSYIGMGLLADPASTDEREAPQWTQVICSPQPER